MNLPRSFYLLAAFLLMVQGVGPWNVVAVAQAALPEDCESHDFGYRC